MITEQKAANIFRGKTARACESCVRKRARWYCAADDAFLCHGCDTLVHSANQLAGRHERVRLESTASSSKVSISVTTTEDKNTGVPQAWYNGFTRKARTPRSTKASLVHQPKSTSTLPVVPELGYEDQVVSADENDEQLLYRVPVFDPFEAEICNIYNEDQESDQRRLLEIKSEASLDGADDEENMCALDNFSEFLPSDVDLAEFAADVESLLTKNQDDEDSTEKQDFEKPVNCKGEEAKTMEVCTEASRTNAKVKEEEDEGETLLDSNLEAMLDITSCETMSWNFDYESLMTAEEDYKLSTPAVGTDSTEDSGEYSIEKKNMFLRLNYEGVITAWASQGTPWTTGHPPEINPYTVWPDCLGTSAGSTVQRSGSTGTERGHSMRGGDAGREARVSRYREKRRTRLFAKKIRYEVRKLNAESRPRMKGRFVKRTSFMEAATSFPCC